MFKTKGGINPIAAKLRQYEPHRLAGTENEKNAIQEIIAECINYEAANAGVTRASAVAVGNIHALCEIRRDEVALTLMRAERPPIPELNARERLRRGILGLISGHTSGEVGKTLQESYYIEKGIEGNEVHRPRYLVAQAFSKWSGGNVQWVADHNNGVVPSTEMSFTDWYETVYFETLNNIDRARHLKNALKNVRYLNEEQRAVYEVRIVGDRLKRVVDEENLDTATYSTMHSGPGWAIFVLSPDNKIYAGSHITGQFHHSSFLAGTPVQSGGEFQVTDGIIQKITPKTGHYRADETMFLRMLFFCRNACTDATQAMPQPYGDKRWFPAADVISAGGDSPS